MKIEKVILACDLIIEFEDDSIVLIKRANEPFKDQWALPGGIMDEDEIIENTAIREAKEETGLDVRLKSLIGVYSKPGRDPRGRTISILFSATVTGGTLKSGSDAKEIIRTKEYAKFNLAFDHHEMIKDFLSSRQKKI